MKLTCVTAVFNAIKSGNRENLIRCVRSVAALKTEHEHLIYDGASTDGTVELLRKLEANTPSIKVVSEPDTGIYNALNKGVRDARGEWFYVLGCDDYLIHPEVLDNLPSQVNEDAECIASTVIQATKEGDKIWFTSEKELNNLFCLPCVCHQGELMRTDVLRSLNGFDERYQIAADSDLFFRAHLRGCRFQYFFKSFAYFEQGGIAQRQKRRALLEHRMSISNVLKLNGWARWQFMHATLLPKRILRKLSMHNDLAIRQSADAMLVQSQKIILRYWLRPFVVLSRPFRLWLAKKEAAA